MKEHPILFSTDMVKAILEGRKTQTRRVMKPQPEFNDSYQSGVMGEPKSVYLWKPKKDETWYAWENWDYKFDLTISNRCPYGQTGDQLWVRETFDYIFGDEGDYLIYKANNDDLAWFNDRKRDGSKITWKPSIHMPRWASRLSQTITAVRVERLQDITENDALAEGISQNGWIIPRFKMVWDSINAKRGYSWESNPWVWVIIFNRDIEVHGA